MKLSDLPYDLHFLVLSYVPADSLLRHCRLVCHRWKEIVNSQTLWKMKCERDGFLRHISHLPVHFDWKRLFLKKPFGRNLIKNPCGENGFHNWQRIDGGDGWSIEDSCDVIPEAESQKCFVSSYGWCLKVQIVDLIKEGLWEELLDFYQPDICISDWYGGRQDCGCVYEIKVLLLAADKKTVTARFENSPPSIQQWNDAKYHKVSCVFRNYGPGVRFVRFFHKGKDTQFWAGHYGARITNSSVTVSLNRAEALPGVEIIEKDSQASGREDDKCFDECENWVSDDDKEPVQNQSRVVGSRNSKNQCVIH